MRWDIFCRVIDNHGDLGVCWRLACDLAGRGHSVRLWIDEPSALEWMAPESAIKSAIERVHWRNPPSVQGATDLASGNPISEPAPADVIVEAFGCQIDPAFAAQLAAQASDPAANTANTAKRRWINLEYLSAESYVERCHGLPSPIMSGPASGLTTFFFYPGFTPRTGGLLREPGLRSRQDTFDAPAWLAAHGIGRPDGTLLVSLFCYEPAVLPQWLNDLSHSHTPSPIKLLVTQGRARRAVEAASPANSESQKSLSIQYLPYLTQPAFDELLWSCDLNFVRGEDSLVRALWAGKPFVWHIYPQDDGAHIPKLEAFLDCWLDGAPPHVAQLVRDWHRWWNAASAPEASSSSPSSPLHSPEPFPAASQLADWHQWALSARERLWQQEDLVTQLIRFLG